MPSLVNETLSGYATFMRAFRNFHEKSVLFVFSYWPVARNTTRDLLAYIGLDGRKFTLYFSGDKRIEDKDKKSNNYRQFSSTSKLKTLKMFPLTLN